MFGSSRLVHWVCFPKKKRKGKPERIDYAVAAEELARSESAGTNL